MPTPRYYETVTKQTLKSWAKEGDERAKQELLKRESPVYKALTGTK